MDKERIRSLLRQPLYRARLAVFMLLGVVLVLAALLVSNRSLNVSSILVDFAIVFFAVGLISFMWDLLGGDPIELQMTRRFSEVHDKLDSTRLSMTVLSDIVDRDIGIERIWPNRRAWESDAVDGLAAWKDRVCQAEIVDIVSNTLHNRWFQDLDFLSRFFDSLAREKAARILIYHPNSRVLGLRAANECDPRHGEEMPHEIRATLEKLVARRERLRSPAQKKKLRLRLTTNHYHLAQIIRADDQMLIAVYLSCRSGSHAPTFQLKGPHTEYFKTYMKQIDILWKDCNYSEDCEDEAQDVDDNAIRQILAQGQVTLQG